MSGTQTVFGSLEHYEKGGVQVIDDDPKHYVFSNAFEMMRLLVSSARSAEPGTTS